MFDDDDRRLVQVASIANAVGAAENASPWRALLWLAQEAEARRLPPFLHIPVRMRTVDTTRASLDESLRVWRSMVRRVKAALANDDLKLDRRDDYLPSAASTWHVHVNDLLKFVEAATMSDTARAELLDLAGRHEGSAGSLALTPDPPDAATAAPEQTAPGSAMRWTPALLDKLAEHHATHGTNAAAKHFGVNVSRVGALLRKHRATATASAEPTAHAPFPRRRG